MLDVISHPQVTEEARRDRRRPRWADLARFVVVGGFSLVVDVGTLWIFHGIVGIVLPVATALAFGCAFVVNFFVNRSWTFRRKDSGSSALARYAVLVSSTSGPWSSA